MNDVIGEVVRERTAQDKKWGEQNHRNGTGPKTTPVAGIVRVSGIAMNPASELASEAKKATDKKTAAGHLTYADIFLEEVFEALAEEDPEKLRVELIQCAAVAVAWIEKIDRDKVIDEKKLLEEATAICNKVVRLPFTAQSPAMDVDYWTRVARAAREVHAK